MIAELQQQVADLQQQLHDMTGSRDNLQGVNTDLSTQLAYCQQLKTQVESELRQKVADLEAEIQKAQGDVATHQATADLLAALKADLQKVLA